MGNGLLAGKKGLILGVLDEKSLAWAIAKACKEEGAELVFSNLSIAIRFSQTQELANVLGAKVFSADLTKKEDVIDLITNTKSYFGGSFDFVLHSVAMSYNIRKKHAYFELNHEYMLRSLDVSAVSLHRILQACYELDALNEWGSVLAMTFIAAHRAFLYYNEMADAKAMLESITRNFGAVYGDKKHVRINTISQSPVHTTSGNAIKEFDNFVDYSNLMSPLGNAPIEALAKYCVTLFSDYTRYVTMQNLFHDGGFNNTGLSEKIINNITLK